MQQAPVINPACSIHFHSRPTSHIHMPKAVSGLVTERERQVAKQGYWQVILSFCPLFLIPSHFILPETQMWCLEVQGPSCDHEEKSHMLSRKGETQSSSLSLYKVRFWLFLARYIPKCHNRVIKRYYVLGKRKQNNPRWSSMILSTIKKKTKRKRVRPL
jgi:hypothetical protein